MKFKIIRIYHGRFFIISFSLKKTGRKCSAKSSKFHIYSKSIPYDENLTMKLRHKFKTGAFSKWFVQYQLPLRRCRIIDFLLYYLNLCLRTALWYHTKKKHFTNSLNHVKMTECSIFIPFVIIQNVIMIFGIYILWFAFETPSAYSTLQCDDTYGIDAGNLLFITKHTISAAIEHRSRRDSNLCIIHERDKAFMLPTISLHHKKNSLPFKALSW